jgi:Fe-S cluster assembly ATP-binding protein
MLKIKNLNVEVQGQSILKGINLQVNAGEIHAIMGPNGSGKSTLSKVLAGHPSYQINSGDISYLGHDLVPLSPEERARAGIFLSFQYPLEIPGVTNINFLKASVNAVRKGQGNNPMDAIEFLTFIREKCRLLEMDALEPKLAILDETDSGLDIDALRIISAGVNAMRSPERSIILVTHYQRLLDYIEPDFIHVLVNGRIIKSGDKSLALELEKKGYSWLEETV